MEGEQARVAARFFFAGTLLNAAWLRLVTLVMAVHSIKQRIGAEVSLRKRMDS